MPVEGGKETRRGDLMAGQGRTTKFDERGKLQYNRAKSDSVSISISRVEKGREGGR